jgi:hypothetical protein
MLRRGVVRRTRSRAIGVLFGNKLRWFESQYGHFFFFTFGCFKLTDTQTVQEHIYYRILRFRSYHFSVSRARSATDADILLFFRNSFFFVY